MTLTKQKGFTLLELLIVLVIVGILSSIGFVALRRYTIASEIRQTQRAIVTEINRARSDASRLGVSQEVRWTKDSLTVESDGEVVRTLDLNTFRAVEITSKEDFVSFTAPYGRAKATETTIELERNNAQANIFIFGIRGKVYTSAPTWSDAD